MEGNASEVQTAAVLIALRTKGETVDELVGLATTMRRLATPVDDRPRRPDRHRGHRRRAADVQRLDHRGADRRGRRLRGRQARQPLRHRPVGLGRRAGGARRPHRPRPGGGRALHRGGRASASCSRPPTTAPRASSSRCARSSPCARSSTSSARSPTRPGATRQVIGVSDAAFLDTIAGALARLGARKALVVSSADGLDEMSTSGTTRVVEVDGSEVHRSYEVSPEDVGLPRARPQDLAGGTPEDNADTTRRIFAGEAGPAARPRRAQRGRRDLRRRQGRVARGRRARGRGGDRRRPRGRRAATGWWR